jgi:hypothetical protein
MTTDPLASGPASTDPQAPEPISADPQASGPETDAAMTEPQALLAPDPSRPPRVTQGETPLYKGEPLDAERGPGLGCFWLQVILLGTLLVLTPLTVLWAWDERISAVLLIVTLLLLLFAGQTVIFLLRLVAADRRTRRVPRSPTARRTVGMLEDQADPAGGPADTEAVEVEPPPASHDDEQGPAPSDDEQPPTG